jgi:hypothetical protein
MESGDFISAAGEASVKSADPITRANRQRNLVARAGFIRLL